VIRESAFERETVFSNLVFAFEQLFISAQPHVRDRLRLSVDSKVVLCVILRAELEHRKVRRIVFEEDYRWDLRFRELWRLLHDVPYSVDRCWTAIVVVGRPVCAAIRDHDQQKTHRRLGNVFKSVPTGRRKHAALFEPEDFQKLARVIPCDEKQRGENIDPHEQRAVMHIARFVYRGNPS
jgi:hypothetical protein